MSMLKFNQIASLIAFTLLIKTALISTSPSEIVRNLQATYQACWRQWGVLANLTERDQCANTCTMEEMGWFTENQNLNVHRANEMARQYFGNDEESIQLARVVFDDCSALPLSSLNKCQRGGTIAACVKRDLSVLLDIGLNEAQNVTSSQE